MDDPSTPVPSDEAVEAAARVLLPHAGVPECERDAWRAEAVEDARATLDAAYAIDAPRIAAEAAAEARAARTAEIVAMVREEAPKGNAYGYLMMLASMIEQGSSDDT